MHECRYQSRLLLHALGHALEVGRRVQLQLLDDVVAAGRVGAAQDGGVALEEGIAGRGVGEADLAGHVAHVLFYLCRSGPAVETFDGAPAFVRVEEAHQVSDGGGLAGSIGAHEAEGLSFFDLQMDVEDAPAPSVVFGQMIDSNE